MMKTADDITYSLLQSEEKLRTIDEIRSNGRQGIKSTTPAFLCALCMILVLVFGIAGGSLATQMALKVQRDSQIELGCHQATDSLLGHIPWTDRVFEEDDAFVRSDPWVVEGPGKDPLWASIFPSAWVAVGDPSVVGFGGGVNLSSQSEQSRREWDPTSEGYGVAIMHQIHCVAVIKHTLREYRAKGTSKTPEEHQEHCAEYLRQSVMCSGDLTLELPIDQTYPQGTDGWGSVHRCRDWDKLIEAIRTKAIVRGRSGWTKLYVDS